MKSGYYIIILHVFEIQHFIALYTSRQLFISFTVFPVLGYDQHYFYLLNDRILKDIFWEFIVTFFRVKTLHTVKLLCTQTIWENIRMRIVDTHKCGVNSTYQKVHRTAIQTTACDYKHHGNYHHTIYEEDRFVFQRRMCLSVKLVWDSCYPYLNKFCTNMDWKASLRGRSLNFKC